MKCPECKANLSVEEGRKYCFCQYCGTKIMLEDDRVNKTYYTYRNEARLRQAEIDREIALKKLEIEKIKVEQEEKRKNKNRKIKWLFLFSSFSFIMSSDISKVLA